jgi:hypothetical protein
MRAIINNGHRRGRPCRVEGAYAAKRASPGRAGADWLWPVLDNVWDHRIVWFYPSKTTVKSSRSGNSTR